MKLKKSAVLVGMALLGSGTYIHANAKLVSLVNCDAQVKFNVGIGNRKCNGVLDPNTPSNPPVIPPFVQPTFVQMVNAKYKMALDDDGNVWEASSSHQWAKTSLSNIRKISVSYSHAVALTNSGEVYVKGENDDGQLGLGDLIPRNNWTKVSGLSGVTEILASGGDDGCIAYANTFVVMSGVVHSTGSDEYTHLGRDASAQCGNYYYCDTFGPTTLTNVKALEGGLDYIFALTNTNQLYSTWDSGDSNWTLATSNVSDFSVTSHDVFAVQNGDVIVSGQNVDDYTSNSLNWNGFDVTKNLSSPSDIASFGSEEEYGGSSAFALKNGTLYAIGDNTSGQMGLANQTIIVDWLNTGLSDVVKLFDDGGRSIYVEKSDGKYYYPDDGTFKEVSYFVDTDGDGISDDQEIEDGTDPTDGDDFAQYSYHPKYASSEVAIQGGKVNYVDDGGLNESYSSDINQTSIQFTPSTNNFASVEFVDFSTELSSDILAIYNGASTSSSDLMQICTGKNCEGMTFTSTDQTGALTFSFQSDYYGVDAGWNAKITEVPMPTLDTDNDGIIDIFDPDDDNDGASDEIEIDFGTDPLDPNDYPIAATWGSYFSIVGCTSSSSLDGNNNIINDSDIRCDEGEIDTTSNFAPSSGDVGATMLDDVELEYHPKLTHVDFLSSVTHIGDDLFFEGNENLTDLSGLSNITLVEDDIKIIENNSLVVFDSLSSLVEAGYDLEIEDNQLLTTIKMDALEFTDDDFYIKGNPNLTSLSFNSLTYVGYDFDISDNDKLSSLEGLNNLVEVDDDLLLNNNPLLTSLKGLESLEIIDYDLDTTGSPVLDYTALSNLKDVGDIIIDNIPNQVFPSSGNWCDYGVYNVIAVDDDSTSPESKALILSIGDACGHIFQPTSGTVNKNVTEETLYYDDSGSDNNYSDNVNSILTMNPRSGESVNVTFDEFYILAQDYLNVYNGSSTSAPLLQSCTNTDCNAQTFLSSAVDGTLTFEFISNASGTNGGWKASVSSVNATLDTDNDGTPDYIDEDDDNDGVPDTIEAEYGTDPLDSGSKPTGDMDNDGKPDWKDLDNDNDTYSDVFEQLNGSDHLDVNDTPNCQMNPGSGNGGGNGNGPGACTFPKDDKDSDGDGQSDQFEFLNGSDPFDKNDVAPCNKYPNTGIGGGNGNGPGSCPT